MSEYNIRLSWKRETDDFDYKTYNRKHTVFFYGGPKIEVNSAPEYLRNPQFHSPEELLAAAISSCLLLTFLSSCAKKGIVVDTYQDNTTCILSEIEKDKQAITEVILRPLVSFPMESKPDRNTLHKLFNTAHEQCFIANSLNASITINPNFGDSH